MPHVNAQGRRKGWREVLLIEKNEGYKGVNLWRDGVRHYYSVVQLRRLLQRKSHEVFHTVLSESVEISGGIIATC
jgi:hypothetical protein